jgi:hypothetical protein
VRGRTEADPMKLIPLRNVVSLLRRRLFICMMMYSTRINELRCTQEHLAGWSQTPIAPGRHPHDLSSTTGRLRPQVRRETLDRVRVVRERALVVSVPSHLRHCAATLATQFMLPQPSGGMLIPLDVVSGGSRSESRYHMRLSH